jgi:DNA-binding NtrC family response regulator
LSDKVVGSIRERAAEGVAVHGKLKEVMSRLEAAVLRRALEEHNWNRTRTARTLGISRQALLVKLQRYKLVGASAAVDEPAPTADEEAAAVDDVDIE